MKSRIETIMDKLALLAELREKRKALEASGGTVETSPAIPGIIAATPAWDKCTLASCWDGPNAAERRMNMLSPFMPDAVFDGYLGKMLNQGCNASHVFLNNRADGEYAGHSIYGPEWTWQIDEATCAHMRGRIEELRAAGLAVVVWLMADDSAVYAKAARTNFPRFARDLAAQGFFRHASTVVLGLELNEYWSRADVSNFGGCIRQVYEGKVGTHQTSGNADYAQGIADILFYQVNPGMSESEIEREARRVRAATGLPLNFFELSREPDRVRCVAALAGGAFAVGNWDGGPL